MMQDPLIIPVLSDDPTTAAISSSSIKPGQSIVSSVHRTKIAGHSRLITVTWSRNLFGLHGLSVSLQHNNPESSSSSSSIATCKVELKPWCFWRKQGSKKFEADDGLRLQVFWDLRGAKFSGEAGPRSGYYVALVCCGEAVLLLGDLKKEAYKKTGCRPASIEAALISKKEHVFGKKRFSTTARFAEKGMQHEIVIECGSSGGGGEGKLLEPRMVMKMDGEVAMEVKHLQWKFRGNETICLNKERVEVYWDVHDWLFSPGLSHALFIFKPLPVLHSSLLNADYIHQGGIPAAAAAAGFCLFLYAWKIE